MLRRVGDFGRLSRAVLPCRQARQTLQEVGIWSSPVQVGPLIAAKPSEHLLTVPQHASTAPTVLSSFAVGLECICSFKRPHRGHGFAKRCSAF